MSDPNKKQADDTAEPTAEQVMAESSAAFDAVAAAAELADSLGDEASPAPSVERMQQREILELATALDQRNEELALARARAKASEGEVDKVRQRVEREAAKQFETKLRKVLLAFLDVVDDLDRALVSVREDVADGDATQEVVRGVELVRASFLSKLSGYGVSPRACVGEAFDPNLHEALTLVPVTDPAQNGVIIAVIREGYMIGEEVLRAAGVAVGRS